MPSALDEAVDDLALLGSSTMPERDRRGSSASVRFSRTDMSGMMPSTLRSSEQKPRPARDRIGGSRKCAVLPSTLMLPASGRSAPKISARRLGAARAEQARQARRSRPRAPKADVVHPAARAAGPRPRRSVCVGRRGRRRESGLRPRADVGRSRAEHGARRARACVIVRHRRDRDGAAVAHDRDAVADRVELVELVADEDHRDAVGLAAGGSRRREPRPRARRATRSARP